MTGRAPPLVLHVIHHLVIGGMENGLVNIVNNMPASRYRHAIACIDDYSDFRNRITNPDVEVHAMHRPRIGVWRLRRQLFALFRRLQPAIVHSRGQSGLDALLPARLAGVPYRVHGEHGWDVADLHGTAWKPRLLRRLNSPLVTGYVAVSKDIERYLVERVGIASRRITQIYNGVDTTRFRPDAVRSRADLPAMLQGEDIVLVGTVGRLQPVKDQATLLRSFANLVGTHGELKPRMRLAMVGDGPMMRELQELARSLGIENVTWFSGGVSNVDRILRCLDVFVLPSLNEGISNTILEAMACALPVVVTRVGGNRELVQDGVCGRFFEPGDVLTLSAILSKYAGDRTLRARHGEAARQTVLDRFSLDSMTDRYQSFYDGLRERDPTRAG